MALYLVRTLENRKSKRALLAYVILGVEALAFLLSFSMGAMGTFAVACLVYLAVSDKEERLPLFLLMLETVMVTFICAFGSVPGLGVQGGMAAVPVVLSLVCGLGIWLADSFIGCAVANRMANHGKATAIAIGGFVAALAVYILVKNK